MDISIGFSNFEVGRKVADLFLSRGLTRVAYVGGRCDQNFRSNARFEGLQSRLEEEGLAPVARIELTLPMPAGDGVRGLDRVLAAVPLTQAIFFSADTMAIAALLKCNRRGMRVPKQPRDLRFRQLRSRRLSPAVADDERRSIRRSRRACRQCHPRKAGWNCHGPRQAIVPLQLLRRGSA